MCFMSGGGVGEGHGGPCTGRVGPGVTVRSKLNKFEHVCGRGSLFSDVQGIMAIGHMGPPVDRRTQLKTLPSRNFFGGW